MLTTIQTKILAAILAVLLAIAGTILYHRHERAKAAFNEQEQYEQFRRQVEADRKKHDSSAANESKTWQSYIP